MEDKRAICAALAEAIKLTRDHRDLEALVYHIEEDGDETVTAVWHSGDRRKINVTLDSGMAVIRDILRSLY